MATPGLELTVGGCECCEDCVCLPITLNDAEIPAGGSWDISSYGDPYVVDGCPTAWRLLSYNACFCEVLYSGSVVSGVMVGLPASVVNSTECPMHVFLDLGCPAFAYDCSVPAAPCSTDVLASQTTNPDTPVFDLSAYQDPYSTGTLCGAQWRVVEIGYGVVHYSGVVSDTGILVDLPDNYTSPYSYNGYMELQIGCVDCVTGEVTWPASVPPDPPAACPCCTDVVTQISLDITFPEDSCNTGCCTTISGTLIADINGVCAGGQIGSQCYCSTDICDACNEHSPPIEKQGEGIVCCDAEGDPCDYSSLMPPRCFSQPCHDTTGCLGETEDPPTTNGSDTVCVSQLYCSSEEVPGYGCERIIQCSQPCQCGYVQPSFEAALDCSTTSDVIFRGTVSDGVRTWSWEVNLGPAPVDCSTAVNGMTLTLTEETTPGISELCGEPTVIATIS